MERFVCDLKWQWRLSWAVSILLFVAIAIFGAPVETFFYGAGAELLFFTSAEAWYERQRRIRR